MVFPLALHPVTEEPEKFDSHRIRFKRSPEEVAKDSMRQGNPYSTKSKAAAANQGCAVGVLLFVLVGSGVAWLLANLV